MALGNDQITNGLDGLKDRYAPRFEVFIAKPVLSRDPFSLLLDFLPPIDPTIALEEEKARLDAAVFVSTGEVGAPPPKLSQLIPLAGPWGDKPDQHTDDILSVEFTESIEKQQLATVNIEVLNVYDFVRQFYRYTDIPPVLSAGQLGVYPLIEYGDTLALRFGYGADIDWVFEGIVTKVDVSFPADGESVVSVTATDKRDRLRCQKKIASPLVAGGSEEQIIGQIVQQAGLRVAAPVLQNTPSNSGANRKAADQDALQYVTDRANKASLELLCFGDTLFVYKPADTPLSALRYVYRAGLTSFKPTFNGVGQPTEVRVVSQDPYTGQPVDVTVGTQQLQDLGLVPSGGGDTATDTIATAGQGGEKTELVTNYLALSHDQAELLAAGILKRNIDKIITATGEVLGDPRIRPRVTLQIDGVGRYSGLYYVTSATHRLGPNGYQTSFSVRHTSALAAAGAAAATIVGAEAAE
jgi:hypothetical protein